MQPTAEFMAEAKRVHEKALELARNKKKATAELAYALADIERRKLYEAFGKTDVYSYAVDFGLAGSFRHARELVEMVQNLQDKPKLRNAFLQGEIDWTKMRAAGRAATPATEDRWLQDARKLPTSQLEAKARDEKGDPTPVHWKLKLPREDAAEIEQALAAARAVYGRRMTDGQALTRVCREWRLMQAGGMTATRSSRNPANRVVITRCSDCDKAWQETRSGRVELSPEQAEEACCDAEYNDVRNGPAKVTHSVPPVTRRFVFDRHGDRCAVPGCRSVGYLHVHHEPGRKVTGHDRKYLYPACDQHHSMRHRGLLYNTGDAEVGFAFFLADGTRLTDPASEAPPMSPAAGGAGDSGLPHDDSGGDVQIHDLARESDGGEPALPAAGAEGAPVTDGVKPGPADEWRERGETLRSHEREEAAGSHGEEAAGSHEEEEAAGSHVEEEAAGSHEQEDAAGSHGKDAAGSHEEEEAAGSHEQEETAGSHEQEASSERRAGVDVPRGPEAVVQAIEDLTRDARLTLIALEIPPHEAEERVRRAFESLAGRGEDATAEALVREALQGGAPERRTAERTGSKAARKTGPPKRGRRREAS